MHALVGESMKPPKQQARESARPETQRDESSGSNAMLTFSGKLRLIVKRLCKDWFARLVKCIIST
jgi:hypothetical protein